MTQDNKQNAKLPDQVLAEFLDTMVKEHPTALWQSMGTIIFHLMVSRMAINYMNSPTVQELFAAKIRHNTVVQNSSVEITPILEKAIERATAAAQAAGLPMLIPGLIQTATVYDSANDLSGQLTNVMQEALAKVIDSSLSVWEPRNDAQ